MVHADSDGSNRSIRDEIQFVRLTRSRTRQFENKGKIFDVEIPSVGVSCVRARQIENKKNKAEEIIPPPPAPNHLKLKTKRRVLKRKFHLCVLHVQCHVKLKTMQTH